MRAKLFELRDRATFIPVLAVEIRDSSEAEAYLMGRVGMVMTTVRLMRLDSNGEARVHDYPIQWGDRTFKTAHEFIRDNFNMLETGSVVDVEYILGETDKPKLSERFENGLGQPEAGEIEKEEQGDQGQ